MDVYNVNFNGVYNELADSKVSKSGDVMTGNIDFTTEKGTFFHGSDGHHVGFNMGSDNYARIQRCNSNGWVSNYLEFNPDGTNTYGGGTFTGQVSVPATNGGVVVMNSRIVNQAYNSTLSGYVYIDFQLK